MPQTIIDDVHQYWRRYIDRAFPLIWIDKENGVAIFSLMFNAVSGRATLGTNAIGHLDRAQAERLIQWLRDLDSVIKTVIVMEHYPIARWPNEIMPVPPWPKTLSPTKWWNDVKDSKMYAYAFLVNNQGAGAEVLRTMRDMAEAHRDRSYFLLFGHRHLQTLGKLGNVTLVEAPNVAARHAGFYLGTKRPDTGASIAWCPLPFSR
jgi:hypothetical protein